MTIVVLLLLGGMWAAVLASYIRGRTEGSPVDSISGFRRQLLVLERTGPPIKTAPATRLRPYVPSAVPPALARTSGSMAGAAKARSRRRRRDVLCGLLAAMGGSLLLSFVPGLGVLRALHLVLDVLFIAYVALLVRMRQIEAERDLKVTYLPSAAGPAETVLLYRRSGS